MRPHVKLEIASNVEPLNGEGNILMLVNNPPRGRLDKPMIITQENIHRKLGRKVGHSFLRAVQDVLDTGVSKCMVMRVSYEDVIPFRHRKGVRQYFSSERYDYIKKAFSSKSYNILLNNAKDNKLNVPLDNLSISANFIKAKVNTMIYFSLKPYVIIESDELKISSRFNTLSILNGLYTDELNVSANFVQVQVRDTLKAHQQQNEDVLNVNANFVGANVRDTLLKHDGGIDVLKVSANFLSVDVRNIFISHNQPIDDMLVVNAKFIKVEVK